VSEQLSSGGIELSPDEIEALHARWSSCWTPIEVAQQLAGIGTPWYVAAGWALDLFRGRQTRAQGDIEIAIPAANFLEVRYRFPGNRRIAIGGHVRPLNDLTHRAALGWLYSRRSRWPHTANPHLLIAQRTPNKLVPASQQWTNRVTRSLTATLERLRVDRRLEEALTHGA
jgi:hypothetical protein